MTTRNHHWTPPAVRLGANRWLWPCIPRLKNPMSVLGGDARRLYGPNTGVPLALLPPASRRRHLARCQTRWSPPSNSGDQNKGSVRNTDSCNISPGPGSHSISQNTDAEEYVFSSTPTPRMNIYEYYRRLFPTQLLSLLLGKLGERYSFMPPFRTFGS